MKAGVVARQQPPCMRSDSLWRVDVPNTHSTPLDGDENGDGNGDGNDDEDGDGNGDEDGDDNGDEDGDGNGDEDGDGNDDGNGDGYGNSDCAEPAMTLVFRADDPREHVEVCARVGTCTDRDNARGTMPG